MYFCYLYRCRPYMPKSLVSRSRKYSAPRLQCLVESCGRWFRNQSGLRKHVKCYHPQDDEEGENLSDTASSVSIEGSPSIAGSGRVSPAGENVSDREDHIGIDLDVNDDAVSSFDVDRASFPTVDQFEDANFESQETHTDFESPADATQQKAFCSERIYHPVLTGKSFIYFIRNLNILRCC